MHADHQKYLKFTTRSRLDKSVNSLLGLIEGIAIDGVITTSEVGFLQLWLNDHAELQRNHPFNELLPIVKTGIANGVLTQDERKDVIWLCDRLRSTVYYDHTTADVQRLHAILGGIVADGQISEEELRGLSLWLKNHEHLKTCWPYDEIDTLVTVVLKDKKVDEQENKLLKEFCSNFVTVLDERTIVNPKITKDATLIGLCDACPEIKFEGSKFCFTGEAKNTRTELANIVNRLGGEVVSSLSPKVKYLVIGAEGNPCWAYACYGRKVEEAVKLRKLGVLLFIVHENDFHGAVADRK